MTLRIRKSFLFPYSFVHRLLEQADEALQQGQIPRATFTTELLFPLIAAGLFRTDEEVERITLYLAKMFFLRASCINTLAAAFRFWSLEEDLHHALPSLQIFPGVL